MVLGVEGLRFGVLAVGFMALYNPFQEFRRYYMYKQWQQGDQPPFEVEAPSYAGLGHRVIHVPEP